MADTVPYRGANPAMQDLISGRVDYLCDIITTAKPQIDGGPVKAIAILTRQRSPALPDVPTAIEQGFDVEAYTWNGFFLPRGTPDAIVQKLNHATVEAMKTPEVRAKLESAGLQFVSADRTTPDYLAKFVQDEIAKWAVPIKAGGISVDWTGEKSVEPQLLTIAENVYAWIGAGGDFERRRDRHPARPAGDRRPAISPAGASVSRRH